MIKKKHCSIYNNYVEITLKEILWQYQKEKPRLEPYQFDYLLLCAKICGASHYNMQMKIVVESEKDFNKWLNEQKTFSEVIQ